MSDLSKFRELGISDSTLNALRRKGFENPSPIQALAIPLLLDGSRDVIGQAHTGTGKTAAFGIPIVEQLERGDGVPQALILSPTRELSLQITEELLSLQDDRNLRIASFYGGQSIEIQLKILRSGVDVVVGTPGRIIDLLNRGKLRLDQLLFAVLDEADEMLNMGFIEDIETIMGATNPDKRTLMFSATMPPEILRIAERFMREYEIVRTRNEEPAADLTEQLYFEVRRENKLEALARIIDMEEDIYAMVFCRTRTDVDELTEKLQSRGYGVEALHGDIAQAQRTKVINRFKKRQFQVLIATDVAARGIDVNDLTHVINFSIPQGPEAYVHRIGRTGRAGKRGIAITFVTPAEIRKLALLKRATANGIRRGEAPGVRDIVKAKKKRYIDSVAAVVTEDRHRDYLDLAEELLAAHENPAAAVAAMLRLNFKDELLESGYPEVAGRGDDRRPADRDGVRLFVGVGKRDGFGAVKMLDMIFQRTGLRSSRLGKIDCCDSFSFVNAGPADAERIIAAFANSGPRFEVAGENQHPADSRRPSPARDSRDGASRRHMASRRADGGAPRRDDRPKGKLRDLVKDIDLPIKAKRAKKARKD